jgi:hypothetical protein
MENAEGSLKCFYKISLSKMVDRLLLKEWQGKGE